MKREQREKSLCPAAHTEETTIRWLPSFWILSQFLSRNQISIQFRFSDSKSVSVSNWILYLEIQFDFQRFFHHQFYCTELSRATPVMVLLQSRSKPPAPPPNGLQWRLSTAADPEQTPCQLVHVFIIKAFSRLNNRGFYHEEVKRKWNLFVAELAEPLC